VKYLDGETVIGSSGLARAAPRRVVSRLSHRAIMRCASVIGGDMSTRPPTRNVDPGRLRVPKKTATGVAGNPAVVGEELSDGKAKVADSRITASESSPEGPIQRRPGRLGGLSNHRRQMAVRSSDKGAPGGKHTITAEYARRRHLRPLGASHALSARARVK